MSGFRLSQRQSWWLGHIVPAALALAGLVHPDRSMFYSSLWLSFFWISVVNLGVSTLIHVFLQFSSFRKLQAEARQKQLEHLQQRQQQSPSPAQSPQLPSLMDTKAAIFEATRAAFTAACLVAWPVSQMRLGQETAFASTLEEASPFGVPALYVVKIIVGVLAADAYNYWKHRLLHHPSVWAIHRTHHQFKDPNTFAGFAIHPIEALLTFFPVLFVCQTFLKLWWSWHVPVIALFTALNFYLHCGFEITVLEKFLNPLLINTSTFHNVHHEKTTRHFGEMMTLWDRLCGTDSPPAKKVAVM
eukprot:m.21503 g.21503  ORF g.21503 m.21503 type:complete len:301 (+) comp9126_c0_seq1:422-1324(+)